MIEQTITLPETITPLSLFGHQDEHLRDIRRALGVEIVARGRNVYVRGDDEPARQASQVFYQLKHLLGSGQSLDRDVIHDVIQRVTNRTTHPATAPIKFEGLSKTVTARTSGQADYVDALRRYEMVFCIGPAGSGKTYLAVSMALSALKSGTTRKIVLVRPAVEAGERLGYLPGDMLSKVNPYLRPLLDALHDLMDAEQTHRYIDNDLIEIVPLAFMRGRTLNDATIILDEGQNTTVSQMKMFLTRMGQGSKIIVTGDITQIDLPDQVRSGLVDAVHRLGRIDGIAVVELTKADIVRHPLVKQVVDAYEAGKRGRNS